MRHDIAGWEAPGAPCRTGTRSVALSSLQPGREVTVELPLMYLEHGAWVDTEAKLMLSVRLSLIEMIPDIDREISFDESQLPSSQVMSYQVPPPPRRSDDRRG